MLHVCVYAYIYIYIYVYIVLVVYLTTLSAAQTKASNDIIIRNNELEKIWKETVVT
jgi:hypothetical protein